jgi:pyrroloquinoline quinone biosynthesis protein B
MALFRCVLLVSLLATGGLSSASESGAPYLYVLGVVQDAGYPQAGCYEAHCLPGWRDPRLRRGAVSLGLIDTASQRKYLFEATPDLPAQLYALESEAPAERFELAGIFLTHAHIGHYAGLMHLGREAMGARDVPVYAMPRMAGFLRSSGPWSQLVDNRNIRLLPLADGQQQDLGGLRVTPFLVPHRDEYAETVGYRIAGPNHAAVFIPDIDKWQRWQTDLAGLVGSVDYALLDATFFADGELPGRDMSQIPHPFVTETMAALEHLPAPERRKVWFIHMNHTNPLLVPGSAESRQVRAQGYNIAAEGLRLGL